MADQKLIDFISEQLRVGIPDSNIKEQLLQSGWQEQAVLDAFQVLNPEVQAQPVVEKEKSSSLFQSPLIMVLGAIVILAVSVGVAYAASGYYFEKNQPEKPFVAVEIEEPMIQKNIEPSTEETMVENDLSTNKSEITIVLESLDDKSHNDELFEFYSKLENCEKFKLFYSFADVEGQNFEKGIAGMENGLCNYYETLPNNGRIDCKLNNFQAVSFAKYFVDAATATTTEFSYSSKLSPAESESETTTKVSYDGEEAADVYMDAFQDGSCVTSGYDH